jgi:hypothetical protein
MYRISLCTLLLSVGKYLNYHNRKQPVINMLWNGRSYKVLVGKFTL